MRLIALLLVASVGCALEVGPGAAPDAAPAADAAPAPDAPPRASICVGGTNVGHRIDSIDDPCGPIGTAECAAQVAQYMPQHGPTAWRCDVTHPIDCAKADRCDASGCSCGDEPACGLTEVCAYDPDDPHGAPHCVCYQAR